MRILNIVCACAFVLLMSHSSDAQTDGCEASTILPLARWTVQDRTVIRLDDEVRRNDYAQAVMEKGDRLFVDRDGTLSETALKFSSVYSRMLGDPENLRRFFSTQSETQRLAELRRQMFSVKTAGEFGRSLSSAEVTTVASLLNESQVRRWRNDDWIGDFPALVINRAPPSRFRELMMLEQNAGDFLPDEKNVEKSGLMALGDAATGFRGEFVSKQGLLTARTYSTLASALYDLQIQKPQLCVAYFQLLRYWLSRSFLERYAASYRVGDVHLHGQIPIWEEAARNKIRDLNIFSLLKDSFFVTGVSFVVKGDRVMLDRWVLEPVVATIR